MERDRTLGHQEPHWKEFRFDLTQIPEGEMVTAAEFRIYKMASTHLLNGTLHVSMFEVVREQSNRCPPHAPPPGRASVGVSGPAPEGTCPRGQKGSSLESTPPETERYLTPGLVSLWGVTQTSPAASPCPAVLGQDLGQVTELLGLSFHIAAWAQ